ncbi:MAG: DNA mismatch repair endonuclease MutL [bacterium]|nr:DNA mismatch repair endonuclease MutL [bacterium]
MSAPLTRPNIRPLPERLINKIAAGEVVERPAAVVKELVENALDAGSTRIDIIIEQSGSKMIKIVDNGWGIPEEQIEIAFSRHATSKLSGLSDLEKILSYGFRGEALPSIASVSRTRMVSRVAESQVATEIIYEGGVLQSKRPVAGAVGTTIEVGDLFFNTPARRKFMKAESTEARYLSRTATALALARYDVAFSYTLNGRQIFSVPAGTLRDRVAALLGYGKQLLEITAETGAVKLQGFIGKPDQASNNRWGHYIFINGRYIHSTTFSHALSAGFGEMLPKGVYPVGAVLLQVEPTEVDVNVHPAKTEVRLSREREIYDAIYHAVKTATRQDGVIPVFLAPARGENRPNDGLFPQGEPTRQGYIPGIGGSQITSHEMLGDLYRPPQFRTPEAGGIIRVDSATGEILESPSTIQSPESPVEQIETGPSSGIRLVGRFSDLYLLLQAGEDLYIVDQHTAHERVLYEETMRRLERQSIVGQQLLLPVQIELTPERFSLFVEAEDLINKSGFAVAPFGGRMISIEAVPMILSRKSPEKVFTKVLDDIGSLTKGGYDLKKAMAQSIACRAAVMSGDRLTDEEAIGLLQQLLQCENKYSCPHGRPTFIKINRGDLDRQFGRC